MCLTSSEIKSNTSLTSLSIHSPLLNSGPLKVHFYNEGLKQWGKANRDFSKNEIILRKVKNNVYYLELKSIFFLLWDTILVCLFVFYGFLFVCLILIRGYFSIYFRDSGRKREGQREMLMWENHIDWLPPELTLTRAWAREEPTTEACALDGNWTQNPMAHRPKLYPLNQICFG